MTDFNRGDRISLVNKQTGIRLEGVVERRYGGTGTLFVAIDGTSATIVLVVEDWDLEEIRPSLPTERGSVIRILKWRGVRSLRSGGWNAMLTTGGWRRAVDYDMAYTPEKMQESVNEFEVIHTP